MKKALVTGGMGFIGGHLVDKLVTMGVEVLVMDKSIYKPTPFSKSSVTVVEADLMSAEILKDCLHQVDTCFHLAAISSLAVCNKDWIFSHQNNVLTFNILLDILRNTKHRVKLVYASSAAVYGNSSLLPLKEDAPIIPASAYGGDKLSNELYAQILASCYGIPSIGLRLFNVYGSGQQESNPYSGVITLFKKVLTEKKPVTIYGSGDQTRDFIYVADVVEGFIKAATTEASLTGVFNICTGQTISIKELALIMMDLLDSKEPIHYASPRIGDLIHSQGCTKQAQSALGFKAKTPIYQGIEAMLKAQNTM
ncbi:MAG: NAD-dependent epimerase/dehydratase family protein [Legionellales bacterium]